MKKCIGLVRRPDYLLKYFVFGNRKEGYWIGIQEIRIRHACAYLGKNADSVIKLARKMKRGAVFPGNLGEIVEDYKFKNDSY